MEHHQLTQLLLRYSISNSRGGRNAGGGGEGGGQRQIVIMLVTRVLEVMIVNGSLLARNQNINNEEIDITIPTKNR